MHLKTYLRKTLTEKIEGCNKEIELAQESLGVLDETNTRRADYVVTLDSCWAKEGEKSTTTEYNGTLKDAIASAEADFKRTNERTDVQAFYYVQIRLGDCLCMVPEQYWDKLKEE